MTVLDDAESRNDDDLEVVELVLGLGEHSGQAKEITNKVMRAVSS
jgi:hypothetical protein